MPKAKQQEPNLRTSCNNCSSAKVRCEKNTVAFAAMPTCLQCTRQNLECVYDVSQRKGKPFQPYPKNKPADVAQNVENGQRPQNLDNSNSNSNTNSSTTNKNNACPWPKTGWNLSDIGPEIDFSSASQNPTDDINLTLPRKHDMFSIMSNLRSHLLKLEKLLNSTYGSDIPKVVAEQYLTEFRTISATIQQLLICKCRTCAGNTPMVLLLATLSSSLVESYLSIAMNLIAAFPDTPDDSSKVADLMSLASSLKLEMGHFRDICRVIRERASLDPEAKAVGEAFSEMLCGQVERALDLLNTFFTGSKYSSNWMQNPIPASG